MKMGSFSKKASFSKKPLTNTVVNALAVESTPATDVNLESLAKPEEPKPAMRSTTPRETEAATKVQSKVRGAKAKAEVAAMKKAAAAQKRAEVEAMTIITSLSDELLMSEKAKRAGAWPASPPRRALWLVLLVGLLLMILPHILLTYTAT
jgi:ferric-dicitrate binding protein FerR (iron transport regulator)